MSDARGEPRRKEPRATALATRKVVLPILLCVVAVSACGAASSETITTTVTRKAEPVTTGQAQDTSSSSTVATSSQTVDANAASSLGSVLRSTGSKEGAVAFADLAGGKPSTHGSLSVPYAWSTIKTVIVATLLHDLGGPSRLSASQRSAASSAITASDNNAAMSLFNVLRARHGGTTGAARRMQSLLRKAGDSSTVVSTQGRDGFSPYGQTRWSPAAQTQFMAALERGCLVNTDSRNYLMGLMKSIVSGQRWGLGNLGSVPFKGGWGPDRSGGYLVRQIGLIRPAKGGGLVAVAIAVRPSNGSFGSGTSALGALARWAKQNAPKGAATKPCK